MKSVFVLLPMVIQPTLALNVPVDMEEWTFINLNWMKVFNHNT